MIRRSATVSGMEPDSLTLRRARVGELLNVARPSVAARRLAATAYVVPGASGLAGYLGELARGDFKAWDGRVVALDADREESHRVVIVDRYGQVYDATDAADTTGLPDAAALEEWFRFLATACPECGVLDDPIGRAWVP